MMQKMARVTMVALLLAAVGCEDSSNNSSPSNISGTWTFSVRSTDGDISFSNTSLVIAPETSGATPYTVAWVSPTPNGTATFDAGTLTVVMNINGNGAVLSLDGTMSSPNSMSGGGTVAGYGAVRVVSWQATR